MNNNNYFQLYNGIDIPCPAIGFYQISDYNSIYNTIRWAYEAGVRHFDLASAYKNEVKVGKVFNSLKLNREEIYISSKVWNSDQGYQSTINAFNKTLKNLGVNYLDQYLIHWAVKGKYLETWKALEFLYLSNKVKVIGVSNFLIHHIEDIIVNSKIVPMVNQFEHHPYLTSVDLINYCKKNKILVEAYSALMRGQFNKIELLESLEKKYDKTKAQILLRWNIQKGILPVFKSATKNRIFENSNVFNFFLTDEDISLLDALNINKRLKPATDPDNVVI